MDSILTNADIQPLIRRLITFLGPGKVKEVVHNWRAKIKNSHGIQRRHHMQRAFDWWSAFDEFWEAERYARGQSGHVAIVNLTGNVIALARDAQKVLDVVPTMPLSVQQKFKADLTSLENAQRAFFEIMLARHYIKLGHAITWFEDSGKQIPEFVVATSAFEFEVECKHMSVDKGMRIHRLDFCRLGDLVEKRVHAKSLMGRIQIDLKGGLSSQQNELIAMADALSELITVGARTGTHPLGKWGTVELDLMSSDNCTFDFQTAEQAMRERIRGRAHAALIPQDPAGTPKNSIEIVMTCQLPDVFPEMILGTLDQAAKNQLSGDRAGVLGVYLPEIEDFEILQQQTWVGQVTDSLFRDRPHVAAVVFTSHDRVAQDQGGLEFYLQALVVRNSNCSFLVPTGFRFMELEPLRADGADAQPRTNAP